MPDLIDFYISKGISIKYLDVKNVDDLSSDHVPMLMTISTIVRRKQR